MNLSNILLNISFLLVIIGLLLYLYYSIFSKLFFSKKNKTTPENASKYGDFINGLTGPIFALAGFLIVYSSILKQSDIINIQQFESVFYKMLDYHRDNTIKIEAKSAYNCKINSGNSVWLSFWNQINSAKKVIDSSEKLSKLNYSSKLDIAFATFYYGKGKSDSSRLYNFIKKYNIPNQTIIKYFKNLDNIKHCKRLSIYFIGYSNIMGNYVNQYFSFIKSVDDNQFLLDKEKRKYINMLKLQNDNYCQIILYYYYQSNLCNEQTKNLCEKYFLFVDIDKTLLSK